MIVAMLGAWGIPQEFCRQTAMLVKLIQRTDTEIIPTERMNQLHPKCGVTALISWWVLLLSRYVNTFLLSGKYYSLSVY